MKDYHFESLGCIHVANAAVRTTEISQVSTMPSLELGKVSDRRLHPLDRETLEMGFGKLG